MTVNHPLTGPAAERLLAARLALFYGAYFAAVGIHLPFWPVWLEWRGLDAVQIGYVLAAAFWPRILTSFLIPAIADRMDERRRPIVLLAAVTLAGVALFAVARDFWPLLWLSLLTGATWAAILPLGEALALGEAQRADLSYGRIRLWGSIAFILAAIGVGQWLEDSGPAIVLWALAAALAAILGAAVLLPEGRSKVRPATFADFRRLAGTPEFLAFVAAAGLLQVSHALYYGFATLHWRAAGHGELVIGLLWAEGVVGGSRPVRMRRSAAAPARADRAADSGRRADRGALGAVGAQHRSRGPGAGAGAARGKLRRRAPRRHALPA